MSGAIEETYVKEENKVDVEETLVNFDCVKKEPKDEFDENGDVKQYKITLEYENVGETSNFKFEENKDNLVGFMDNDVIMQDTIKLENIKDELPNDFHCNKCNGIYKGFCLTCSTLLCILNDCVSLPNSKLTNIPADILEIKESSTGKGVFLLKTLPKNVIFGPFEGITGIKTTEGSSWKISDNKLLNADNGNWIKYVCASSALFKNLNIFQIDDCLYFQTIREIMEGEELLVYFADAEIQKLINNKDYLYTPQKREKLSKIYACTLCCLGFGSEECLSEHKKKCPRLDKKRSIKDFELIECQICKIWLEKSEHEEYHNHYCSEKHQRRWSDYSQAVDRNGTSVEKIENQFNIKDETEYDCKVSSETSNRIDSKALGIINHQSTKESSNNDIFAKDTYTEQNGIQKKHKRLESSLQINPKKNLNELDDSKQFQCVICFETFSRSGLLKSHLKMKYGDKKYKCSECSFQTNYKPHFDGHLNKHRGIKPYECDICKKIFTGKDILRTHVRYVHAKEASLKKYKCSECPYRTRTKDLLDAHVMNKHNGIKPFECNACLMKFTLRNSLTTHTKNQHSQITKDYKCTQCNYETNVKGNLKTHLSIHTRVKPYKCAICLKEFTRSDHLKNHTKAMHKESESSRNDKTESSKSYNCLECSYQTDNKGNLMQHLKMHTKHKPFHGKIDMYFGI